MYAIGIDVGSTNVKAVLVAASGETVQHASRPVPWEPAGAVAELDAEALWAAVRSTLAALGAAVAAEGDSVGAIGVCGQYSSIVPIDGELRPVAPMRLYLDQRGTRHCQAILERDPDALMTWMERHPVPPIGGGLALGHLLAFQLDEPAIHAATACYLEPVDYITTRLTGRATATQASMFASQLVDNRRLDQRRYDPELVQASGVDPDRLPPLIGAEEPVGALAAEVAAGTGLTPSTMVMAGMTDSHAAALATGAARPGRMGLAIGTTAVLLTTTDHLHADFDNEVLAMAGVRAGEYLVWAENGLAGRAVEQVLSRLVHADDALGDHRSEDPFVGFDAALAASPAGAGGVRFLPWLAGSMAPQADGAMRGGFVGVSLDTARVDLVRAAAEGVAHNLRWLLGPVEAFAEERAEELVLVGGAARSSAWCQILADVLGRPARTVADPAYAGARAVAAWAAGQAAARSRAAGASELSAEQEVASGGGSGLLGSVWAERYRPDPTTATVHAEAHEQFTAAFAALAPLRLGSRPRRST